MALEGIPLSPGRATGPVQPVEGGDPDAWDRGAAGRVVVAAGSAWPPPDLGPPEVVAAVFERRPPGSRAGPSFPVVAGIDSDVFAPGDRATVDGVLGTVEVDSVPETGVVTAFLERDDGRILLLRRSARVGSFRGRWAAVSGYLEDPTPEGQAVREVGEETGLAPEALTLQRVGRIVYARDGARIWAVHPFRFRVARSDVVIDWEHTEFEWVDPSEIRGRPTVPKLDRAWAAVAPAERERQKG